MKKYNPLQEVRLNQVRPKGWILDFLQKQASGMPGNLHRIGYPYDRGCWKYRTLTDGGYAQWWPYEQTAYWIDSVVRTAIFTDDQQLLQVVMEQIEASFAKDGDPFIGPLELKENQGRNRWPHAVYFRALYALWSNTGEERYLEKMRDHYLSDQHSYAHNRDVANLETMLKLYQYFGDKRLFDKAVSCYEMHRKTKEAACSDDLMSDRIPNEHGVTFNEDAKLPAILYAFTGEEYYLQASIQGYKKIDAYHMLPDGVHSSSEKTCGNESWRTHESCDISDFTWSLGYLLEATGNGEYADKIEWAIFNALPGAVGPEFKTIQYLSCVNQVIAARNSTHIAAWKNTPRMAFQPHHYPECCVGNIGRAMPNYVARMYQTIQGGVAVSLYGDSVYNGHGIKLVQQGGYPFGKEVTIQVTLKQPDHNKVLLRVPSWSKATTIKINGTQTHFTITNGYAMLTVQDQDTITLSFSKGFSSHNSTDGGIYFTYGPFLLSLKIKEDMQVDQKETRQTPDFPAYNILPASDWAYAVTGWEQADIIEYPPSQSPFWKDVPLEIKIKAKKLSGWTLVEEQQKGMELVGNEGIDDKQVTCGATIVSDILQMTPPLPDPSWIERHLEQEEEITLVPYGCTNIRLTVFPKYQRQES